MVEKTKAVKVGKAKDKLEQPHMKKLLTHQRHTRPLPKKMYERQEGGSEASEMNTYTKGVKKGGK